jgi:hypothetical protein
LAGRKKRKLSEKNSKHGSRKERGGGRPTDDIFLRVKFFFVLPLSCAVKITSEIYRLLERLTAIANISTVQGSIQRG